MGAKSSGCRAENHLLHLYFFGRISDYREYQSDETG